MGYLQDFPRPVRILGLLNGRGRDPVALGTPATPQSSQSSQCPKGPQETLTGGAEASSVLFAVKPIAAI